MVLAKTKEAMLPYVSYCVDTALHAYSPEFVAAFRDKIVTDPAVAKARIVGWQCGFEPMCVAVFSYLPDTRVDDEEASEIAVDLLRERGWFADPTNTEPDFII